MVRRGKEGCFVSLRVRTFIHIICLFGIESGGGARDDGQLYGEEYGQPRRGRSRGGLCRVAGIGGRTAEAAGGMEQGVAEGGRVQRTEREGACEVLVGFR